MMWRAGRRNAGGRGGQRRAAAVATRVLRHGGRRRRGGGRGRGRGGAAHACDVVDTDVVDVLGGGAAIGGGHGVQAVDGGSQAARVGDVVLGHCMCAQCGVERGGGGSDGGVRRGEAIMASDAMCVKAVWFLHLGRGRGGIIEVGQSAVGSVFEMDMN